MISKFEFKVHLPILDNQKRQNIWTALENQLQDSNADVRLSRAAQDFLRSSTLEISWNGHDINHCFRLAVALARANAGAGEENGATVEVAHFKEAMNSTHEFRREYMPVQPPRMGSGPSTRPGIRVMKTSGEFSEDSDSSWSSSEDDELPNPASLTLASDSSLCIPSLNHVEWETFQAAGKTRELFRNSNFHAIDVLEGEPQIVFSVDDKTRGRARFLARKTAHANSGKQSANIQQEQKKMTVPDSEVALPERIRINSPAIVKAFSEIHEEEFSGSFLMFKPFASLLYYEQDFRDWVAHREETIRGQPIAFASLPPVFLFLNLR